MDWFAVDKEGLSQLVKRRGTAWVLHEVVQNGLDQDVTRVDVRLEPIAGCAQAWLTCEDDDPRGFERLSLAWTLFADTSKRSDPTKAGRFTIGEKLVLSLAYEAEVSTTTGTVRFDKSGRHASGKKREAGSKIAVRLPMTRAEYDEICTAAWRLLPRAGVVLTFNGGIIPSGKPVRTVEAELPTEFADEERSLRRTSRQTTIEIHETDPGEPAMIYEMGIPVVETGDRFHVNVLQRVPLNAERDNVTPAYLRQVRTIVLNATHDMLSAEEAKATWVTGALEDPNVAHEAVEQIITARYGEKRVIADPSDPEGTKIAMSQGYTVIPGGALSREAWENVHSSGAARPAGQVTPSPKPFHEGGRPLKVVPEDDWTDEQRSMADFVQRLHARLVGGYLHVALANEFTWPFGACYGRDSLTLNLGRLGHDWFTLPPASTRVMKLLLHEFSHARVSDHLSREFHEEVARLGALAVEVALETPELFERREV